MSENGRVLITGGAGFIGSSLALRLVDDFDVVILDNLHRNAIKDTGLLEHPRVLMIQGDVMDRETVRKAMEGCDHVVHMAAIAGVDTVMNAPVLTMRVALQGTMNVIETAYEMGGMARFIDFSTSEVFGRYAYKVTEGHVSQLGAVGEARWTYAVSKLATEHLALSYHRQYGFPAVSIRPFNIYGPHQVGEGAVHHFIDRALAGEDLLVHNDGSQIRSWCFIDDIVDGVLLAMKNPKAVGEAFNIGNPRSTLTIYNLAREIVRLCESGSKVRSVPWEFADVELRIPDVGKARQVLGFEPRVDLEEGLVRTIAWYRQEKS
ncbi:MAG: NAD-dependent epimerase/dehydratase family protein [Deltaproteobacteria bacterium]|nr:NAD-dependent epimerase/dehydratase family protein [Deltaproteobacteria bacterium]